MIQRNVMYFPSKFSRSGKPNFEILIRAGNARAEDQLIYGVAKLSLERGRGLLDVSAIELTAARGRGPGCELWRPVCRARDLCEEGALVTHRQSCARQAQGHAVVMDRIGIGRVATLVHWEIIHHVEA